VSWIPGLVLLQEGAPSSPFSMLVPMAAIFLIFYLLLIRPQQKQRRQHEATLKSIEKGDSVVTSGGLHGRVTGVTDDVLTLEIASLKGDRVRVKQARSRIESVQKARKGEES
jgi:preprotein translocase subunit YajC